MTGSDSWRVGVSPAPAAAHRGSSPKRILLVTNDFPPRPGGIQSYLQELVQRLADSHHVTVYAPRWKGCARFDAAARYEVIRHPTTLMLPSPGVRRRMVDLVRAQRHDAVWFGAAAPLALLSPAAAAAGAAVTAASTHGHEVGWSMLPAARSALRHIGEHTDVITYVSRYTRGRFASAFGPRAVLEHLPAGVDTVRFRPDPGAREELRRRYGLGRRPTIVCVSRLVPRKGQDMLIAALPHIRERVDGAALVIVGGGPHAQPLRALADRLGVADHVVFTGGVAGDELPAHHAMADVFAMPCRTRGAGLDVEGLGIVFLEASACGVPVVAGNSGGAPETVRDGQTGRVVDGRSVGQITDAIAEILADPDRAAALGSAGRAWVTEQWRWDHHAARFARLLAT